MGKMVDRINKRFSKNFRVGLNIIGLILFALVLFLLYKLAKNELVYFLGKNFWLFVVGSILLLIFIIFKLYSYFADRIDERLGCYFCVFIFQALIVGLIILGSAIHTEYERIDHQRNPLSIEQIVSELTARYESDGGQVEYSPEFKRLVVTLNDNPDLYFGGSDVSFLEKPLNYCKRESRIGFDKFNDYGYNVNVYYLILYDSGQVFVSGKNGESHFGIEYYTDELGDLSMN